MWRDMLNSPNLKNYDVSSVKCGIMGGSQFTTELVNDLKTKMGVEYVLVSTAFAKFWFLSTNWIKWHDIWWRES